MLRVSDAVPAQSLAFFRVVVGLVATVIGFEFAGKTLFFTPPKPLYNFLPVLPVAAWTAIAALMTISSVLVVLGAWTRFAALATGMITFAYILGAYYSNHTYLLATLMLLLAFTDSGAALSIRAHRESGQQEVWGPPVYLLRAQISIVYVYAAVNKLNFDFLSGNALASMGFSSMVIPDSLRTMPLLPAMAAGAVAAELFIGIALWVRRLRPFAVAMGFLLHINMIVYIGPNLVAALDLSLFAAMMIAGYMLFVDQTPSFIVRPISGTLRWINAAASGGDQRSAGSKLVE